MKASKGKTVAASMLMSLITVSLLATVLLVTLPAPVKAAEPQPEVTWFQKDPYTDYAQSGVPDFDQRQNSTWKNPYPPYVGSWSWCGPVAVANSLWWMDSRFETGSPPPPTYSDTFPLVQSYGPWDDKDPRNVDPLVGDLARLMLTDVQKCGTLVGEMETGIHRYLINKGLEDQFYERTWECNFTFYDIEREIRECEDVVLLLGFYEYQQVTPGQYMWVRVGGHYVTVAGVGRDALGNPWIKFSDPILNYAEDQGWGPPYVLPPPPPGPHTPHPTDYILHNNATYVSHDPYRVGGAPGGCGWGPLDYNATGIARIGGLAANGPIYGPWQGGWLGAAVEAAVIVSPLPPITQRHLHHEDGLLYGINLHSELNITKIDLNKPISTHWHELYPRYCRRYHLTSWEDTDRSGNLTQSDQIDMMDEGTGKVSWYHVDWVTITLNVTYGEGGFRLLELSSEGGINDWQYYKYHPVVSYWHEKYPDYSKGHTLTQWYTDSPPQGQVNECDWFNFTDQQTGHWWVGHIIHIGVDLRVSRKPLYTEWHELYPVYCKRYTVTSWQDLQAYPPDRGALSPGDVIGMRDRGAGSTHYFSVENVTVTINVTKFGTTEFKLLEAEVSPEYFYYIYYGYPVTYPTDYQWHEVYPVWCNDYHMDSWYEESPPPWGALSPGDYIWLANKRNETDLAGYFVQDVATDIKVAPSPYFKPPYEDYAPSGMPDFDQKQDNWKNPYPIPGPTNGSWSWCGPTAVANSLWYFDSKFETETGKDYALVQNYGPWDDHSPSNVVPLINRLGWYMDTDGNQTGAVICGTEVHNMSRGIIRYLTDKGLNNSFTVGLTAQPTFAYIEAEVERCEDVVLLLGFWQLQKTGPVRVGGHFVTVAGVYSPNLTLWISDPMLDAAEMGIRPGRVLPVSPHPPGHTHNDAQYVSQDMYNWTMEGGTPGNPGFELDGYPAYELYSLGGFADNCPDEFKGNRGPYMPEDGPVFTEVEYAIVVSPVVHPIEVIGVAVDIPWGASAVFPLGPKPGKPGWHVNVTVAVHNRGNQTGTFNVTLYYNMTLANTLQGNPQTITLDPCNTAIVAFTWNVTGVPPCPFRFPGYYKAYPMDVWITGFPPNINTTAGNITVRWPGDGSGPGDKCDGWADIFDLTLLGLNWYISYPSYDWRADWTGDGWADIFDLTLLGLYWYTHAQSDPDC